MFVYVCVFHFGTGLIACCASSLCAKGLDCVSVLKRAVCVCAEEQYNMLTYFEVGFVLFAKS